MREPELLVGGPFGGQRLTFGDGTNFTRIPLEPKESVASPVLAPDGKAASSITPRYVDYRRHRWNTPQGEVPFWAPVEMTPMDCLKLLMSAYEVVKSVQQ